MTSKRTRSTATVAMRVLAFVPWTVMFVVLLHETWFIADDAFISFRYARNLIEGHGIVFNAGERVEGYTSLAYVLQIAGAWRYLGVRPEAASLLFSLLFTGATLFLVTLLALRTPIGRASWPVAWVVIGLLTSSVAFAGWSTGGLETRQFTFLVLAACALMSCSECRREQLFLGSTALGAAILTRPEGALVAAVCLAAWALRARRTARLEHWFAALAPALLVFAALLAWRQAYYGEWLPNTYYAKVVRPWPDAGLRYLGTAVLDTGLYAQFPLAALGAFCARGTPRGYLHLVGLACILPHASYVAWIGGDFFEFRFLDFYWPLLALAAADGLAWLCRGTPSLVVLFGGALIVYVAALQGSVFWLTRERMTWPRVIEQPVTVDADNAPWIAWLPGMRSIAAASNAAYDKNRKNAVGLRLGDHIAFGRLRQEQWSPYERVPRGLLPRDAVTATDGAGAMPFYLAGLTVIDTLGLNDRVIARAPVTTPNSERLMAHDRRPPSGYLESRGVNIDVHPPAPSLDAALRQAEFALPIAEGLWMPFDSHDTAWVDRSFAAKGLARSGR